MPRKNADPTPIEAYAHKDKRTNNPTQELSDFIAEDENAPKQMLYPRDPSLDPQLVWKGKDAQDQGDLEVDAVPIYTQEKIKPKAIIEDFRIQARKEQSHDQLDWFGDFNGIDFEKQLEFYEHEQNWANRMILGDSLLVMNSLAEKEGLKGLVQMIYIDPPYGIKFGSNWQVSTRKRDVKDGKAEDLTRQPEQVKAFRDTWELGIHSYLIYLRDRLTVARELLTETGSVFVQINSENSHLVACLMDEVFGSENFVANIIFRKKSLPLGAKHLETMHDHLLFYAKEKGSVKFRHAYEKGGAEMVGNHGPYALYPDGKHERIDEAEFGSASHPKGTQYYSLFALLAPSFSSNTVYKYEFQGRIFDSPNKGSWVVSPEKLDRLKFANRLQPEGKNLRYRLIYSDFPYRKATNLWVNTQAAFKKTYVVQTASTIIERCMLMTTDPGDLVLDPTCGSGTTAYVAEQWGRRWITVDTSRVALALARMRLMTARYPYYILADSPDGVLKEAELTGDTQRAIDAKTSGDLKKGFVYARVPHITLKSIANNPEIDEIHEKWQEQLEPLRAQINTLAGEKWEEWEIPHPEAVEKSAIQIASRTRNRDLQSAIEKWWELRRERQQEIDAAIARHADTEILYDKPYEDRKRIRVTGAFTVESLSPHRVLSKEVEPPKSETDNDKLPFETMILENLKKAGVQNTKKNERLKFDWLEAYAGTYLHAEGEYTENEQTKRVAVSIGPEYGTVGPAFIKEAAKEAVRGLGFDLLVICGFDFDAHASEEAKRYGRLTVLLPRIHTDLMMGGDLLKKTEAANLFTVFGEPDIEIRTNKEGKLVVEIKGVDVYDPTTGMVRSDTTDELACWFIDTNYNEESFFVRHAYFTGGGNPYDKLKRALRADIDEAAWATLYRTRSRPFDSPETGKIAVKVINHYGDEVLKVYDQSGWEN